MKYLLSVLITTVLLVGCNEAKEKEVEAVVEETPAVAYRSFGDKIAVENVLSQSEMAEKFQSLKPGDTVEVTFAAEVKAVCQNKGCWMRLDMGGDEAMVKFKDYGFFIPKDIAGQEVIVAGKAFVEEMSVEEQRHYAEDGGKSPEEVAAITEPKRTLSFLSNGVLLPETQQAPIENQ